jgi:hypothetical protein
MCGLKACHGLRSTLSRGVVARPQDVMRRACDSVSRVPRCGRKVATFRRTSGCSGWPGRSVARRRWLVDSKAASAGSSQARARERRKRCLHPVRACCTRAWHLRTRHHVARPHLTRRFTWAGTYPTAWRECDRQRDRTRQGADASITRMNATHALLLNYCAVADPHLPIISIQAGGRIPVSYRRLTSGGGHAR